MPRAAKPTQPGKPARVLVTGMRKSGDSSYHFKIFGDSASRFPPLIIKMSLHEMQQWLHQMQSAPEAALRSGRPGLRVLG